MIPTVKDAVAQLIDAHSAAGRRFRAGGVDGFAREQGSGADVVLLHGVPTSSFLYRRVLPLLADEGMHAVALDFPGLGLAERPEGFDYSWSGLSRWLATAVDALGLDRCHLVVHDIAGPVGCQWAIANPERVLSVTVLNTTLDPVSFRRPWMMRPFATRGAGEAWLRAPRAAFAALFRSVGLADREATGTQEIYAHHALLRRLDGGRAFLRIMRGFELDEETGRNLSRGLAERPFSARLVWGELDPVFGLDELRVAERVLGLDDAVRLPAKHFLQEDQAPALAYAIADHVAPLG